MENNQIKIDKNIRFMVETSGKSMCPILRFMDESGDNPIRAEKTSQALSDKKIRRTRSAIQHSFNNESEEQ